MTVLGTDQGNPGDFSLLNLPSLVLSYTHCASSKSCIVTKPSWKQRNTTYFQVNTPEPFIPKVLQKLFKKLFLLHISKKLRYNFLLNAGTLSNFPADFYIFKINNKSIRTTCEICSKLTIKTVSYFQLWTFHTLL